MTAEQEKQVTRIRNEYEAHKGRTYSAFTDFAPLVTELYANLGVALSIIDDLQKQQPKRYTEDELRDIVFEKLQRFLPMQFGKMQERMLGWLECARFLGMIKTEGGIMKGSDKDSKEVKE